jgi:hypothetical protein
MSEYGDRLPQLLITLLRGVLYREDDAKRWQDLTEHQGAVQDYLSIIGLELVLHENEGFAFLRNRERTEEEDLPRLIIRRQLSYPVSLLLAQLRRKLSEHDASSGEERLILHKQEIIDLMGTFFVSGSNEVKFVRKIDAALQKVFELGFIRFLGDKKEEIEVKRIIKAFIDAQWLNEFDQHMKNYVEYAEDDTADAEPLDE